MFRKIARIVLIELMLTALAIGMLVAIATINY